MALQCCFEHRTWNINPVSVQHVEAGLNMAVVWAVY